MKEFLIDNWDGLLLPAFIIAAFVIGGIQRRRERKLYGTEQEEPDKLGTPGNVVGFSVMRAHLPPSVPGAAPTGHFQKPDFRYDEAEEAGYEAGAYSTSSAAKPHKE